MKYATQHTHLQQNGNIQSFDSMKSQTAPVPIGWSDVVVGMLCSMLAVFASAVEASVEEAEPLLQVVSV